MTRSRVSRVTILIAASLAVLGYLAIWFSLKPTVFANSKSDFSCFYRAGRMVVAGDASRVYDLGAEQQYDRRLGTSFADGHGNLFSLPFVFPPYSLALFAPMSRLPYHMAELLWYMVNVAMLLAPPFVLRRRSQWQDRAIAAELLAPVLFLPAVLALMQGQPSILLLLLFAIVFAALADGKDARAGAALAFATMKPQLVLPMLLALLIWRKWKSLAMFVWTSIALAGLSVAIVGWHAAWHYPRAVIEFNRLAGVFGGEHPESMPNLRGGIYLLLKGEGFGAAVTGITVALSVLLLLVLAILLWRRETMSPAGYSLTIVVTLLVSYHGYLHDDSLLLLPMLLMAQQVRRSRWTANHVALVGAIAGLYVIPALPTSLSATAMQMLAGMAALAISLALEFNSKAESPSTEPVEQRVCNTPAFVR